MKKGREKGGKEEKRKEKKKKEKREKGKKRMERDKKMFKGIKGGNYLCLVSLFLNMEN